jgi:hypothetical protein
MVKQFSSGAVTATWLAGTLLKKPTARPVGEFIPVGSGAVQSKPPSGRWIPKRMVPSVLSTMTTSGRPSALRSSKSPPE